MIGGTRGVRRTTLTPAGDVQGEGKHWKGATEIDGEENRGGSWCSGMRKTDRETQDRGGDAMAHPLRSLFHLLFCLLFGFSLFTFFLIYDLYLLEGQSLKR